MIKLAEGANTALVKKHGDSVFNLRKKVDQLQALLLEKELASRYS